jgi:hypothetical protein
MRRPRSWRRDGGIREEKVFLLRSMVRRAGEKAAGRGPESARKWSDGSAATTGGELAGDAAGDEGRGGG